MGDKITGQEYKDRRDKVREDKQNNPKQDEQDKAKISGAG